MSIDFILFEIILLEVLDVYVPETLEVICFVQLEV